MIYETYAKDFIGFIKEATSPYHVVETSLRWLEREGFEYLDFRKKWTLEEGKNYYTKPYDTTMFAFSIGKKPGEDTAFRIASSHTDYPCFRLKPHPDMLDKGYLRLNVESYGGLILNSWQDRLLSVAGKVCLKSGEVFKPETRLVDFKRPLGTIPCLAIHMNREVNKGQELKKQTQMLPVIGTKAAFFGDKGEEYKETEYFVRLLAEEIGTEPSQILDFDLYVYNCEDGAVIGAENDFISAPRLDNLTSVYALLCGMEKRSRSMKEGTLSEDIGIAAFYDNEEIGSRSKQGADSTLTTVLLEKIYEGFGLGHNELNRAIMNSFYLSVDVGHCLHPNYAEKNDPTNVARLNEGIVLKIDSTQKYVYDTEAIAAVMQLCEKNDIPFQKFVNHSDQTSGSTLGSIASSWLPMKTVDLGVPLLAMHSSRELMGKKDEVYLAQLMEAFYDTRIKMS